MHNLFLGLCYKHKFNQWFGFLYELSCHSSRREIERYLPGQILSLGILKHSQYLSGVQSKLTRLVNYSELDCKIEMISMLKRWPLFGASFFRIQVSWATGLFLYDSNSVIKNSANGFIVSTIHFCLSITSLCLALAGGAPSISWWFAALLLLTSWLVNQFVLTINWKESRDCADAWLPQRDFSPVKRNNISIFSFSVCLSQRLLENVCSLSTELVFISCTTKHM